MMRRSPVDILVVEAAWRAYFQSDRLGFARSIDRAFVDYRFLARRVVIVGVVPGARANVPNTLVRLAAFDGEANLQLTSQDQADTAAVNQIIQKSAAKHGFVFVNVLADICRTKCAMTLRIVPYILITSLDRSGGALFGDEACF